MQGHNNLTGEKSINSPDRMRADPEMYHFNSESNKALASCHSRSYSSSDSNESSCKECPPDMEMSVCAGCWSKCPMEGTVCEKKDCEEGCACKEDGYLRHNRMCIPAYQCPFIPKEGDKCPGGMVWSSCSGCDDYCKVEGQKCVEGCRIGCVCEKKDHRMYYRKCRSKYACQQEYALVKSCPKGTKWADCAKCHQFCFPESDCASKCSRGCVCRDRRLAIYKGRCIKPKLCSKFGSHVVQNRKPRKRD